MDGKTGRRAANVLGVGVGERSSRLVLLGIGFIRAPTIASNVIVGNLGDLGRETAGPFRDGFPPERRQDALVVNDLLAVGVYLVAASIVGKLPIGTYG